MKQPRITGMDIAIALILPFVVYYGIYLDLGQNRDVFPRAELHLLLDGATAFFLFALAVSTGLSISTGSGLKGLQRYLLKRGLIQKQPKSTKKRPNIDLC